MGWPLLRPAPRNGGRLRSNLVTARLKMVAAKDFYRVKSAKSWIGKSRPLDEGMCHWKDLLGTLAETNFQGPFSLHLEYEIPGVSNHEGIALSPASQPKVM